MRRFVPAFVALLLSAFALIVACGSQGEEFDSVASDSTPNLGPPPSNVSIVDASAPDATLPAPSCCVTPPACPAIDAAPPAEDNPPYFYRDAGPASVVWWRATGDSITLGYGAVGGYPDPNHAYPQFAAYALGTNVHVTNVGQLGWSLVQVLDAEAPFSQHLHDGGVNIISLMGGTNDIGHNNATAAQMETTMRAFVSQAHAAGWTVMVGTMSPFCYDNGWEAGALQPFNAWIRSGASGADIVCETGEIECDMVQQNGVHPNVNGQVRMGERCAEVLRTFLADAGIR